MVWLNAVLLLLFFCSVVWVLLGKVVPAASRSNREFGDFRFVLLPCCCIKTIPLEVSFVVRSFCAHSNLLSFLSSCAAITPPIVRFCLPTCARNFQNSNQGNDHPISRAVANVFTKVEFVDNTANVDVDDATLQWVIGICQHFTAEPLRERFEREDFILHENRINNLNELVPAFYADRIVALDRVSLINVCDAVSKLGIESLMSLICSYVYLTFELRGRWENEAQRGDGFGINPNPRID